MSNAGNLPAYTQPQSVFMLSLASNALFFQTGTQAELQAAIGQFLRGYQPGSPPPSGPAPFFKALNTPNPTYPSLAGGDWSTVWGPFVYCEMDGLIQINPGATNMMFVAHSPSQNMYVVAIAGTNPTGWSAGTIEDLEVGPNSMVAWPPVLGDIPLVNTDKLQWTPLPSPSADRPAIDAGTSAGMDVLYGMVCPYSGLRLVDFLDPKNPKGTHSQNGQTIVFTGHSLGGALAPTLAMLLYPMAAKAGTPAKRAPNPNASQWQNVYIIATAGPTPGNAGFASLFYTPVTVPPLPNISPAPVTVPYPPAALTLTGISGNYMPVATGDTAASGGVWPLMYWNMDYANVYDVVPRAWTLLANLVAQPTATSNGYYPSFFANGASLSGSSNTLGIPSVGDFAYGLIGKLSGLAGYQGNITPFYTQCLMHFPVNGTWGSWAKGQPYPQAFMDEATPTTFQTFGDLSKYILDAHLDQYSRALLGYPGLTIGQAVPAVGGL